jgi:hypothetical protein
MKKTIIALTMLLACSSLSWGSISDPVTDFKTGLTIPPGDKILKWEADLNGDGRNDILLCLKSDFDSATQSNDVPAWTVYIAEASPATGYVRSEGTEYEANKISVDDLPQIDTDTCFVGPITQLSSTRGVVTMQIKNPRSGESIATIYALTVVGTHLKYTQLAQYQPGQSNPVFDQYLKDNVRTQVQLQQLTP